jgi:hypothetical protein
MAKKKKQDATPYVVGAGALALLFLWGRKAKAKAKAPDVTVFPGTIDMPPSVTPDIPAGPIIDIPEAPDIDVPVFDIDPTAGELPMQIFTGLLSDFPRANAGYRIRIGETARGIARRVLQFELGRDPTKSEWGDYYQALTRSRTNWKLYATKSDNKIDRVSVTDEMGQTTRGTIKAAFNLVNDNWNASMQAAELPRRLIAWTLGSKKQAQPRKGWRDFGHGVPPRQLGVLWLPDIDCVGLGNGVFTSAACDWPAQLKDRLKA